MIGRTISGALLGVDGYCVNIEVQIGFGVSNFYTVGLAEGAVRESKVRVRSAFMESDLYFPNTCVTLNLAPADVRKDGSVYRGRREDTVGAHAYGYNSTSIGICAEGNFEVDIMGEAQKQAIIE